MNDQNIANVNETAEQIEQTEEAAERLVVEIPTEVKGGLRAVRTTCTCPPGCCG